MHDAVDLPGSRGPRPGQHWRELDTPSLLVDLDRLEANITTMAALARTNGRSLRPHFKTHKAVSITHRQLDQGASGATCAKLDEAEVLIDGGVDDVLLAYEITAEPKLTRAVALSRRARLILAVDGMDGARALSGVAAAAGTELEVWIEIDSGLRRCGVVPADAAALASAIAGLPGLRLSGVFTHAGNAYGAADAAQLRQAAEDEGSAVVDAAAAIRGRGISIDSVSVGSTPTAALVVGHPGITEIRPGNYVFHDGIQVSLGVVPEERCALTVSATVISRAGPGRAVIDAGSKTLGLDRGAHSSDKLNSFGRLVGVEGTLERLSEEHGMLRVPDDWPVVVGERVRILPNHACAVSNLGRVFAGLRGERVEEVIPIDARSAVQ